jgi:hypothetical protein
VFHEAENALPWLTAPVIFIDVVLLACLTELTKTEVGVMAVAWTAALDDRLKMLRAAGLTWDGVAASMGMGRNTVLERGRRIGARKLRPVVVLELAEAVDRPARQPGHPLTWGLITSGTVLEGEAYPYPVFL